MIYNLISSAVNKIYLNQRKTIKKLIIYSEPLKGVVVSYGVQDLVHYFRAFLFCTVSSILDDSLVSCWSLYEAYWTTEGHVYGNVYCNGAQICQLHSSYLKGKADGKKKF